MKLFPFKNILPIAAYAIFGGFLLYFFIYYLHYHYQFMAWAYPHDYTEASNILPTDVLLQGKNPFDLSNNPQYTNVYGIFYYLLVLPFAKIWGPTLLVHRIVSAFFLFACGFILVLVLRKDNLPFWLCLTAGIVFYPFSLFPGTTTDFAGSNALGLFLFLITIFVPYACNYSKTSLILSRLSGLLAFYTKTYFLLGVPLLASYIFLFKSKKNGLLYGLGFLILFIGSIYAANRAMNCYFNNVFFAFLNHVDAVLSVNHPLEELKLFYQLQKPLFFLIGFYFIFKGTLAFKNSQKISLNNLFSKISLFNWQAPLFQWDFNIHLYGLIIATLIIYFSLGRNMGQTLEYPFQLMSPFFILYIFNCLSKPRFIQFLSMPLILMTLFTLSPNYPKQSHATDANWETMENLIATHQNIYANPLLIPLLIKYHRPVYLSASSEVFHLGANREFLHMKFPSPPEIDERNVAYWNEIWALTSQKKFDFLIMYPYGHPFMPNACALYYRPIGMIRLDNFDSTWHYDFLVLVPK